jgi:hypothetical protein
MKYSALFLITLAYLAIALSGPVPDEDGSTTLASNIMHSDDDNDTAAIPSNRNRDRIMNLWLDMIGMDDDHDDEQNPQKFHGVFSQLKKIFDKIKRRTETSNENKAPNGSSNLAVSPISRFG